MKRADEHLPFLDYLRGLAILLVILGHTRESAFPFVTPERWNGLFRICDYSFSPTLAFTYPLGFPRIGVAIFFVVSGFCIHLSHARSVNREWPIFFLRRFFRIYPPYLLALLAFAFVFPWTRLNFSSELIHTHSQALLSFWQFVTHLFLIHNLDSRTLDGINPAFWSIAVEVQLYCLYPLLLWLAHRYSWKKALWITAGVELGMRGLWGIASVAFPHFTFPWFFTWSPLIFWFSWTLGAALAEAYLQQKPIPLRQGHLFLWLGLLAAGFLLCYYIKPLSIFTFTLGALVAARLVAYWLTHPAAARSLDNHGLFSQAFKLLGVTSYSLYLIHNPFVHFVVPEAIHHWFPSLELSQAGRFSAGLLALLPIIGLAYLFYRWIEIPSIDLGKRAVRWWRQRAATASTPPLASESSMP